jgi:hypothetical protein
MMPFRADMGWIVGLSSWKKIRNESKRMDEELEKICF